MHQMTLPDRPHAPTRFGHARHQARAPPRLGKVRLVVGESCAHLAQELAIARIPVDIEFEPGESVARHRGIGGARSVRELRDVVRAPRELEVHLHRRRGDPVVRRFDVGRRRGQRIAGGHEEQRWHGDVRRARAGAVRRQTERDHAFEQAAPAQGDDLRRCPARGVFQARILVGLKILICRCRCGARRRRPPRRTRFRSWSSSR